MGNKNFVNKINKFRPLPAFSFSAFTAMFKLSDAAMVKPRYV